VAPTPLHHRSHPLFSFSFLTKQGVVPIVVSWFTSPLMAFLSAALLFGFIKYAILRRTRSFLLGLYITPFLVLLAVTVRV
jgi:predicted Co/Zn/Cd cation transporter (cation efflux family)